ncbi:hypothetical protein Mro03_68100 [Microbispora rosea subsp. rosea]|nr:hypothetical protein Mro03_68100 [Microbispora rosea subsp. rosea]
MGRNPGTHPRWASLADVSSGAAGGSIIPTSTNWAPTLVVTSPSAAPGLYAGTVTHSVA